MTNINQLSFPFRAFLIFLNSDKIRKLMVYLSQLVRLLQLKKKKKIISASYSVSLTENTSR